MGFLIPLAVLAVVVFVIRRRRRKLELAGLSAERPQFSIAPPTRWSTSGKDHRL